MDRTTVELMREHLRDIYLAATGEDLPEMAPEPSVKEGELSSDELLSLFTQIEVAARTVPQVSERVPPFAFTPALNLLADEHDLVVEVALPGIHQRDVSVQMEGDELVVSGTVGLHHERNGHRFLHAEIPGGPFRRRVHLPHPVSGDPHIKLERGVVRIQLQRAPEGPQSTTSNRSETEAKER